MPEMSSKNQPQLVYISCACRCNSISPNARTRSAADASAVRAPPLDSVRAAPRSVVDNLALPLWWKLLQIFREIGQLDGLVLLQQAHRVGQRHLAEAMMVSIRLAVRCNTLKLLIRTVLEPALQARRKVVSRVQQAFKCDGPRSRPIVEKDRNRDAGVEAHQVWP